MPWTVWPEWAKKIKPKFTAGDHIYLCPHKKKPNKLRGRITNVNRYGAYGQTITYDTDIPWGDMPDGVGGLSGHWLEPVPAVELLGEIDA